MVEGSDTPPVSGIRVLTPDEDAARTVARAMASSTAGGILRSFQGREMTASDIATALDLPIPTIMYHLDALVEAGLIEVSRIKYSVKGREVRVYRQSEQVFIVAPPQADLRAALLKYASLFGFTIFAAGCASFLIQNLTHNSMQMGGSLGQEVAEKSLMAAPVMNRASEAVQDSLSMNSGYILPASPSLPIHEMTGLPWLSAGILIGGFLVIALLFVIEYRQSGRTHKKK